MDAQAEIITIGDFNINAMNWHNDYRDKNPNDKMKHTMFWIKETSR